MESCWYLQERLVHATKKSQYLTMQWTSQNHRGSLSLSLSLVFFVSYTCLHCCFLEMVCLLLFALRCCCCSCPIPFLENNRRNEAYLLFWFSVLFMPRGGDQKNCWNYFHRNGRQAVWILRIANVHDVVQYLS